MMRGRIKAWLVLLLLATAGCDDECIAPGEGISSQASTLFVPVYVTGASPETISDWWVDSGEEVSKDQQFPITVSKSANFCAVSVDECETTTSCADVIVPVSMCKDGSLPAYRDDIIDPKVLCPGSSGKAFSKAGYYMDSGIKVNPGERLVFELIPRQIQVTTCPAGPDFGTYLPSEVKGTDGKYIDPVELCKKGAVVQIEQNPAAKLQHDRQLGSSFPVFVDNSFTPSGNKIYFHAKRPIPWYKTAMVDLRLYGKDGPHGEYDHKCSPLTIQMKQFTSYDVNYRCNTICSVNNIGPNCVVTTTRDWIGSGRNRQISSFDINAPDKPVTLSKEYADLLIAKISAKTESAANSFGFQCLPSNQRGNCMNQSLSNARMELGGEYQVDDSVPAGSSLMLGIRSPSDNREDSVGGYHVRVKKRCVKSAGEGLYLYIGDSPPTDLKPGDTGTYEVITRDVIDDNGATHRSSFTINGGNGENGNPPASGKLYFAIKGANSSDIVKDIVKTGNNPNPDNGYQVNMVRSVWTPDVSSLFSTMRDSMLVLLYGQDFDLNGKNLNHQEQGGAYTKEGIIQTFHKLVIERGLGRGIQAMLVLYLCTSSLAFLFGLVQYPKTALMMRLIKVIFIASMLEPATWHFLTESLFGLFLKGGNDLIGILANSTDADDSFSFLDYSLGALMSNKTWLRMASLITSGVLGLVMFFLVIWGIYMFVCGMFSAMIIYLLNIIGVGILMAVAPIFISFMLFEKTKNLFQGWLKMLMGLALKPVFIFASISLLNQLLMRTFYEINNFQVCKQCWLHVMLFGDSEAEGGFGFCLIKTLMPHGYIHDSSFDEQLRDTLQQMDGMGFFGMPFHVSSIITFVIAAFAIKSFIHISDNMSKSISGTMFEISMAAAAAGQSLLSLAGLDQNTQSLINAAKTQDAAHPPKVDLRHRASGDDADQTPRNQRTMPSTTQDGGGDGGGDDGDDRGGRGGGPSDNDDQFPPGTVTPLPDTPPQTESDDASAGYDDSQEQTVPMQLAGSGITEDRQPPPTSDPQDDDTLPPAMPRNEQELFMAGGPAADAVASETGTAEQEQMARQQLEAQPGFEDDPLQDSPLAEDDPNTTEDQEDLRARDDEDGPMGYDSDDEADLSDDEADPGDYEADGEDESSDDEDGEIAQTILDDEAFTRDDEGDDQAQAMRDPDEMRDSDDDSLWDIEEDDEKKRKLKEALLKKNASDDPSKKGR